MLFASTVVALSTLIPAAMSRCLSLTYDAHQIAENVFIAFFATQSLMTVFVLFIKVRDVFRDTEHRFARTTKITYYALFIAFPLISICMFLFLAHDHALVETLIGFEVLSLMLSVVLLFVQKLVAIYQQSAKYQPSLYNNVSTPHEIRAISKMMILSIAVAASTFLHMTLAALTLNETSFKIVYHFFELLDVSCSPTSRGNQE